MCEDEQNNKNKKKKKTNFKPNDIEKIVKCMDFDPDPDDEKDNKSGVTGGNYTVVMRG